ncbi:MAG: hypothetical protein HC901_01130 [Bdellovibrionaceae bacterium]|nr:hypothetical protein [Pseudobdellovibrionaceae bacterium]
MKMKTLCGLIGAAMAVAVSAVAAPPIGQTITLYSLTDLRYVSVRLGEGSQLHADGPAAFGFYSHFLVEDAGTPGIIRLKALANNLYARASDFIKADSSNPNDPNCHYQWVENGSVINLRNIGNNQYLEAVNNGKLKATSNKPTAGFNWGLSTDVPLFDWRFIDEDPRWPVEERILAVCEVTDPEYNLPANPATTDCTTAFQTAIDRVSKGGGGAIFIPEGQYRIDGPLIVRRNVFLRGRWCPPSDVADTNGVHYSEKVGTVIRLQNHALDKDAIITTDGGSGLLDLTFWHVNQNPVAGVTPTPWVIQMQFRRDAAPDHDAECVQGDLRKGCF